MRLQFMYLTQNNINIFYQISIATSITFINTWNGQIPCWPNLHMLTDFTASAKSWTELSLDG